ncbi:MAG: hypothetical protein V1709_03130 [Planctomycetota bacterium]
MIIILGFRKTISPTNTVGTSPIDFVGMIIIPGCRNEVMSNNIKLSA